MKKIYTYLIIVLVLFSCDVFKTKHEHLFVYEFENEKAFSHPKLLETIAVLKKRLDAYGVDSEVEKYKRKGISVKIKAYNLDTERVNRLLENQGKLEFWDIYRRETLKAFVDKINDEFITKKTNDSLDVKSVFVNITSDAYEFVPVLFQSKTEDTITVNSILKRRDITSYLASEFKNIKFLWGPSDSNGYHSLYAAKSNKENRPLLTGEFIVKTEVLTTSDGKSSSVLISMNDEGALRWKKITESSFRDYSYHGETLNGLVVSVGIATNGALTRGEAVISGNLTQEDAQDLSIILDSQTHIPKLKLLKHSKNKE